MLSPVIRGLFKFIARIDNNSIVFDSSTGDRPQSDKVDSFHHSTGVCPLSNASAFLKAVGMASSEILEIDHQRRSG